jgi:glucose-1-phosphatase
MTGRGAFDVVLFDLGGVLIELGGEALMSRWSGGTPVEELWRRWLTSPSVRDFESGRIDAETFASLAVSEFGLPVGAGEFLEAFGGWPTGMMPGALDLVRATRASGPVGFFTNSNALHWERFEREWRLPEAFDHPFSSHLIGALKPDREAYEHVLAAMGCDAARVLFLDDNQINVDGARRAGLVAHHVRGVTEARGCLERLGVV